MTETERMRVGSGAADPGSAGPTVLWQARIPRDLAARLEEDMRVLGLDGPSDTTLPLVTRTFA